MREKLESVLTWVLFCNFACMTQKLFLQLMSKAPTSPPAYYVKIVIVTYIDDEDNSEMLGNNKKRWLN